MRRVLCPSRVSDEKLLLLVVVCSCSTGEHLLKLIVLYLFTVSHLKLRQNSNPFKYNITQQKRMPV